MQVDLAIDDRAQPLDVGLGSSELLEQLLSRQRDALLEDRALLLHALAQLPVQPRLRFVELQLLRDLLHR